MFLSCSTSYAGSLEGLCWPLFQDGNNSQPQPVILRDACWVTAPEAPAGVPGLLVAAHPRNFHLVSPTELTSSIRRDEVVKSQLKYFSSNHHEAFIPQDVLLPLLLEDLADEQLSSSKALQGNRVAGCPSPHPDTASNQRLVFSVSGPIGDEVSLTCLDLLPSEPQSSSPSSDGPTRVWQASSACHFSLGAEVLQLQAQPVASWRQQQHPLPGGPPRSAAAAVGAESGVWVVARCTNRVDVLWASTQGCTHLSTAGAVGAALPSRWRLEWRASLHTPVAAAHAQLHPYLPEFAVLLTDGRLGLVSLAAAACISADKLVSPLPLSCALLMSPQQAGEVLALSQVAGLPLQPVSAPRASRRMTLTWGYHPRSLILTVQGSLWKCDIRMGASGHLRTSPILLHQLEAHEVFLAVAAPTRAKAWLPRSDGHAGDLDRAALLDHISRSDATHHTRTNSTNSDDVGDGGGGGGDAGLLQEQGQCQVPPESLDVLQPYLAVLTSSRVLLLDLRRPNGFVVAAPHACTACSPKWLAATPLLPAHSAAGPDAGMPSFQAYSDVDDEGGRHEAGGSTHASQPASQHTRGRAPGAAPGAGDPWLGGTQASQVARGGFGLPGPAATTGQTRDEDGRDGLHGPKGLVPNLQLTWGTEFGQVMCWRLCVRGSGVEVVVQRLLTATGRSRGRGSVHMAAGSSAGEMSLRTHVVLQPGGARATWRNSQKRTDDSSSGDVKGPGHAWRPACLDMVQAVQLVEQLCLPGSLADDPRLTSLRPARALLYTPEPSARSAPGGTHSQAAGDRAISLTSHVLAASQAPELQGLCVLPLWPHTDEVLLSRATYDGDLAFQVISNRHVQPRHHHQQAGGVSLAGPSQEALDQQASDPGTSHVKVVQASLSEAPANTIHVLEHKQRRYADDLSLPLHHAHISSVLDHALTQPSAPEAGQQVQDTLQQEPALPAAHDWQLSTAPLDMVVVQPPLIASGGSQTDMQVDSKTGGAVHAPAGWTDQLAVVLQQLQAGACPLTAAEVVQHAAVGLHAAQQQTGHGQAGSSRAGGRQRAVGSALKSNAQLTVGKERGGGRGGQGQVAQTLSALLVDTSLVHHVLKRAEKQLLPLSEPTDKAFTSKRLKGKAAATKQTAAETQAQRVAEQERQAAVLHASTLLSLDAAGDSSVAGGQLLCDLITAVQELCSTAGPVLLGSQAAGSQQDSQVDHGPPALRSCGLQVRRAPNSACPPGWQAPPPAVPASDAAHAARAAPGSAPDQPGQDQHHTSRGVSRAVGLTLAAHASVAFTPRHLLPCTSKVFRWDEADVAVPLPVMQRAKQAAQGEPVDVWKVALSHDAINRYHTLLDAWPEDGVQPAPAVAAEAHPGTNPGRNPSTGTSITDASLFVDGYQKLVPRAVQEGGPGAAPDAHVVGVGWGTQGMPAASQVTLMTTAATRAGAPGPSGVGSGRLPPTSAPRRPRLPRSEGFN